MGRFIIKIQDRHLDWSTVVDAPVTYGMTRAELEAYHLREYGVINHAADFESRMQRVEATGTSEIGGTLDGLLECNRAGLNETGLTADQIYRVYCLGEDEIEGERWWENEEEED